MNERNLAIIKMKKALKRGAKLSAHTYECVVWKYEEKTESIYLNVSCPLTDISLDAIYECKVMGVKQEIIMTGRVVERYICESGYVIKIHIQTGFYKNSIK